MSFLRNKCALLTGLMVASSVAQAQPEEGFTIAPSIGYYETNRDEFASDPAYSLGLGYQFGNPWAIEFTYLGADSQNSTGDSVDLDQIRLDALYHLEETNNLTPYVAAGIGLLDFNPGPSGSLINAGGGLKYAFNDAVSLRGDFRLIRDTENHKTDTLTTIGLHFAFGKNASTSTASEERNKDSDNDGVIDQYDQCLTTPAGVVVDANGCAIDDDKDGVINSLDMCPNSAIGSKVDTKGCYIALEEDETITLDVQFANDSASIEQQYYGKIEEVADFLTAYPETDAVIEGHTDDRGTESYNQVLSEKRAKAVADVLINSFNISQERISSVGYGEVKPLVSNDTSGNRRINRRVTAVISN